MNAPRKSALHAASDSVAETVDQAAETVRDAAETGASRIGDTLRKAQDSAAQAKDALVAGAGSTLASVRDIAVEKADEARETLSEVGERLASTLERASAEDPNDALKSRVLASVAQGLTRASTTLRQRSVADLTDDVRLLAKRHPGAFMAAAAVVGFAAARFVRSSARRHSPGQRPGAYQGPQS
jgi:hypothetical protein